MTRLDGYSPIPGPGWAFRIHALHTSDAEPPYLSGTWRHAGKQSLEPECALWLVLAARGGGVDLALFADHEQIPDTVAPIASYSGLAPGTWLGVAAPAIAAHPYVTCEHTPAPRDQRHRVARAIIAYLIANH